MFKFEKKNQKTILCLLCAFISVRWIARKCIVLSSVEGADHQSADIQIHEFTLSTRTHTYTHTHIKRLRSYKRYPNTTHRYCDTDHQYCIYNYKISISKFQGDYCSCVCVYDDDIYIK